MPRIATIMSPATMSNTPTQASGRTIYSGSKVTNPAALLVWSQARKRGQFVGPAVASLASACGGIENDV
jgi:hypothetical protein